MIAAASGEVHFQDGLVIIPHCAAQRLIHAQGKATARRLPAAGWTCHTLGRHVSTHGPFTVEIVSGPDGRVHVVFLSHDHLFYEKRTPEDSERRVYHEGVIAAELKGQREFLWGQVFCKLDRKENRDWLGVAYTQGPHVPQTTRDIVHELIEREQPEAHDL